MGTWIPDSPEDPPRLPAADIRKLHHAAHRCRVRGWRPYSKFAVAAAVLTKDGRVYAGPGNVECANYSLTKHAEETAAITALARGAFERCGRTFLRAVYIATAGLPGKPREKCAPCGGCRQFLWEFADEDTLVIMELPDGGRDIQRLVHMLPFGRGNRGPHHRRDHAHPFGPANLKIKDRDSPPGT